MEFVVVQHGETNRATANLADPGLTKRGRQQSKLVAVHLRTAGVLEIYSSPLRRTRETAAVIAAELCLPVRVDPRLRERMNWGDSTAPQPLEDFLGEWAFATQHRDHTPLCGDSSWATGDRFRSLLDELTWHQHDARPIVLVTHDGVTVDLLRNLFMDDVIRMANPHCIEQGVPGCGITRLLWHDGAYTLMELGDVGHLAGEATRWQAR